MLTQAIRFPQLKDFQYFNQVDITLDASFKETANRIAQTIDHI